jgi:glycosyltransferase involved in cell wall biosynthesis
MKILQINKFLYPKGGDAISTLETGRLLSNMGHQVYFWGMAQPDNPEYPYKELFVSHIDYNKPHKKTRQFRDAINILYSYEARKKIELLLKEVKPDIVHLHNFAHQISPSILHVLKKYKIPSVMTMHDYKMVCASYAMLVKGLPCERCSGGRYYYCLLTRCTKGSLIKSLVNTLEMYLHHKIIHIYDEIALCISPSRFLMEKVQEMGFKGKLAYLPNFVSLEVFQPSYEWQEESIVYFGRLSHEKGLATLIDAVNGLNVRLKIVGDGPIMEELINKSADEGINNVEYLGYKRGEELRNEIRKSLFVVIPSQWYENNPRSVIEAFALGKPVVGARIGGIPELVKDWETGITFESGNTVDLREKIQLMLKNRDLILKMGKRAREFVERELNPQKHYENLLKLYEMAINK